jgi:hypothetical protein
MPHLLPGAELQIRKSIWKSPIKSLSTAGSPHREVNLEVTNQIPVGNGNPHQEVNVEVANQRPYCQPLFVGRGAQSNHFARVTLSEMVKI